MLHTSLRLTQAIRSFLLYSESKNLSPSTIDWYSGKLNDVALLLGDVPVETVTTEDLRRLVTHWTKEHLLWPDLPTRDRRKGLSPNTVNGHLRAIRACFTFLVAEGLLSESPARRVPNLRAVQRHGTVLSPTEVKQIAGVRGGSDFVDRRDKALFLMLVDSGIRISEAMGMTIQDVDWSLKVATVMGKGRKVRTVPFGRQVARALNSYLAHHPTPEQKDAPLFVTVERQPLTRRRAQHIIERMVKSAGITDRRIGPHALRRTFATTWITNGGDPFSLQRILGHTTLTMTNEYVRLASADLQAKHATLGPVDRLFR